MEGQGGAAGGQWGAARRGRVPWEGREWFRQKGAGCCRGGGQRGLEGGKRGCVGAIGYCAGATGCRTGRAEGHRAHPRGKASSLGAPTSCSRRTCASSSSLRSSSAARSPRSTRSCSRRALFSSRASESARRAASSISCRGDTHGDTEPRGAPAHPRGARAHLQHPPVELAGGQGALELQQALRGRAAVGHRRALGTVLRAALGLGRQHRAQTLHRELQGAGALLALPELRPAGWETDKNRRSSAREAISERGGCKPAVPASGAAQRGPAAPAPPPAARPGPAVPAAARRPAPAAAAPAGLRGSPQPPAPP